nr:SDR family oxidoreductase [Avibacterium endocarditidis]
MMAILITGASAGFGKAMCEVFIKAGYKVIGAARRLEKLEKLQAELGENFFPLQMDMNNLSEIDRALSKLPEAFQQIDLLVNNAGLALGLEPAHQANFDDWLTMINTNIVGLTYITRKVLPQMVERQQGHIINLGSIAGTYPYPGGNVYGATKAFVEQFSLNLRADLAGTKVRVTNVEPGLCGGTEFSNVRFKGDDRKAASVYANVHPIEPIDIANTVLWIYQQPAHVNINSIEIMPVAQSFSALNVVRDKN